MDALLEALRSKVWRLKKRPNVYDEPCNTEISWRNGPNSVIFELALASCPLKTFEFAQLNRSVEMKRHVDSRNMDGSWIVLLGSFTGGALCFDDGRRISDTGRWFPFDGHHPHWVEPFEGDRFSIILFNNPGLSRRVFWLPIIAQRRRLRRLGPSPVPLGSPRIENEAA